MKARNLLILSILLVFFSTQVFSKTIVVTTGSDSIVGSLREAVSLAGNGDIITFNQSLTEIKLGDQINISKSLTIKGNPNLVISGKGANNIFPRVFEITGELEINVNIEILNLVKTGYHIGDIVSYDTNGGIILIRNTNSTVNINLCYFTESGGSSGIINCTGSSVNGQNGGGVAQYGGTLNISNCTFSGLKAGGPKYWGTGGAICQFGGNLKVINSTFFNNSVRKTCQNNLGKGAAIYTQNSSVTITNCTFTEQKTYFWWTVGFNTYYGHTYAISNYDSNLAIKNSIFFHNEGYDISGNFYSGGYNIFEQTLTSTDNTLIFNSNPGFKLNNGNVVLSTTSFWIPVCVLDAAGSAVDALPADGNGAPLLDQQGHTRMNNPDIGACEFEGCIPSEMKATWNPSPIGQDSWVTDLSVVNDSIIWAKDANADSVSISTNGGILWVSKPFPKYDGFPRSAGAICALSETKAYYILSTSDSKGVYKTTNGGDTWTKQTTAFNQTSPFPDVIHFWNENEGVAFGDADPNQNFEIYTTANGGELWNRVPDGNMPDGKKEATSNGQSTFRVVGNSIFFITSTARIFKSLDKGLTWSVVNTPFNNTPLASSILSFDFKDNNNGLVSYCSGDQSIYKMYRTTNGGQTWDSLAANNFYHRIKYIPTANAYFSMNINGGLSYSCDDGQTWTSVSYLNSIKLISASYSPSGKIFWGGLGNVYTSSQSLTVSANTLTIAAPANSTRIFDIISNTNWTLNNNQTWLSVNKSNGSNNANITLTAQANPAVSTRTATITVSGNGVTTKTITVIQDGKTTGINDLTIKDFAIYPNPVNRILYFGSNSEKGWVSVFDINGKLVLNEQSDNNQINVGDLPDGFYTLKIVDKSGVFIRKFVKQ